MNNLLEGRAHLSSGGPHYHASEHIFLRPLWGHTSSTACEHLPTISTNIDLDIQWPSIQQFFFVFWIFCRLHNIITKLI